MNLKNVITILTCGLLILGCAALWAQSGISVRQTVVISEAEEMEINESRRRPLLLQTVRGQVLDNITKLPIENAHLLLALDSVRYKATITLKDGYFEFLRTPVGEHTLRITHIGYYSHQQHIEINSSRESQLIILLEESPVVLQPIEFSVADIQLSNASISDKTLSSPIVSGETINIADLKRYAGTRFESSRQVTVLTGIQSVDDSRNDIVIRGNSPGSVLWRLEGINIPNPNHFAMPGTSGGPVTLINDRMLGGANFYSSAFPAVYGNTISGLFDLNFRQGNPNQYNHTFLMGVMGTEFSSEGPLSASEKNSYLVTGRYSSVALFQKLGMDIGLNSYPQYGDLAFKLNFVGKNNSSWSIFGLGGVSSIDILINQDTTNIYGERDRDQYFDTKTGVTGVSYKKSVKEDGYLAATLAVSGQKIKSNTELVYSDDIRRDIIEFQGLDGSVTYPDIMHYDFTETRISGALYFTRKLRKAGMNISYGMLADFYLLNYFDEAVNLNITDQDNYREWRTRWDDRANALLFQPYVQWKYSQEKVDLLIGLHGQYFSLTNSYAPAEPRLSVGYRINDRQSLRGGFGMHSQIQSPYLYFYGPENDSNGKPIPVNQNLDFTRSIHTAIGYQYFLGPSQRPVRFKTEFYYQNLYDVPVDRDVASSFSLLNTGASFVRFYPNALANKGRGENYGVELTLDRSFQKNYLFMINASIFESLYQGSDKQWRDTNFNGNYIINALVTRQWITPSQNMWSIALRGTVAGGRRHGVVDMMQSNAQREVVYVDSTYNSLQFKPYIRFDLRLTYKWNRPRVDHEFALDLFNLFNRQNALRDSYRADFYRWDQGVVRQENQLGFIPFVFYRIDF
jgi:hypothetical protein